MLLSQYCHAPFVCWETFGRMKLDKLTLKPFGAVLCVVCHTTLRCKSIAFSQYLRHKKGMTGKEMKPPNDYPQKGRWKLVIIFKNGTIICYNCLIFKCVSMEVFTLVRQKGTRGSSFANILPCSTRTKKKREPFFLTKVKSFYYN